VPGDRSGGPGGAPVHRMVRLHAPAAQDLDRVVHDPPGGFGHRLKRTAARVDGLRGTLSSLRSERRGTELPTDSVRYSSTAQPSIHVQHMSRPLYLGLVTLHLTSAVFWLGGMFFLGVVGAPLLRSEPPETRRRLFQAIGTRFRKWGWGAVTILVVTGLTITWDRGWLAALGDPTFRASTIGRALMWKLGLVTAMMSLSALHDFWLGPRAGDSSLDAVKAARIRLWGSWGARLNALLALVLIYVAVRLARGG